jgi:hypothetical protein
MSYHHTIEVDRWTKFFPESRRGLIEGFEPQTQRATLRADLRAWLADKPYCLAYGSGEFETVFTLNFFRHADMLLFKLTWGGK